MRWLNLQDVDDKGVSESLPHLKGLVTGDTATSRIKQVRHTVSASPSTLHIFRPTAALAVVL